MYYTQSERYRIQYIKANGTAAVCYPRSKEAKDEQLRIAKERGIRVTSVCKLYPFSTEKNQHNFELIRNICWNAIYDLRESTPVDKDRIDELYDMIDRADKYFALPLPVAWLPYEDLCEAKELANMAIMHRQEACIANGRPDLVTYC